MTRSTLAVDGMSCDGCERNVVDALDELDGVDSSSADHEAGEVVVEHDPAVADEETIGETIEDAGYEVAN